MNTGTRHDRSSGLRSVRQLAVACLLLCGLVQTTAEAKSSYDLANSANYELRIDGASSGDAVAITKPAGDINGDGTDDLLVSAPNADVAGTDTGAFYVIYGGRQSGTIDLASFSSSDGYIVHGDRPGDNLAGATNIGDVNGDGVPDQVVNAPNADHNSLTDSGSTYVVLGQRSPTSASLSVENSTLLYQRIDGEQSNDSLTGATNIGDQDGDGKNDLAINASGYDYAPDNNTGVVYVIFSAAMGGSPIHLSALLPRKTGYRIVGESSDDRLGSTLSVALSDINADGFDEIVVAASNADHNSRTNSGSAYVIYGQNPSHPRFSSTVDTATLTASQGFRIDGPVPSLFTSGLINVADGGDVNGGGKNDLLVGTPSNTSLNYYSPASGSVYVLLGEKLASSSNIDLAALDPQVGYEIAGSRNFETVGTAVNSAGDLNGDGFSEILLGASTASFNGRLGAGSAYMVKGRSSTETIDLGSADADAVRFDGAVSGDLLGFLVLDVSPDISGDRAAELLINAPGASNNGRPGSGSAYVISTDEIAPPSSPGTQEQAEESGTVTTQNTASTTAGNGSVETAPESNTTTSSSSTASCTLMRGLNSVSRWKAVGSARIRLRSHTGGTYLTKEKNSLVQLDTRGTRSRAKKIDRVVFYLDGKKQRSRARSSLRFNPSALSTGTHTVKASVKSSGKTRSVSLKIRVAACDAASFTASTSSLVKGAAPNLLFTVKSGALLASVQFTLLRGIRAKTSRLQTLRGKTIGSMRIKNAQGVKKLPLRLQRAKGGRVTVASSGGIKATLKTGATSAITVTGLPDSTNLVSISLSRKNRLFANAKSCKPVTFRAKLTGEDARSLSLSRARKLCS